LEESLEEPIVKVCQIVLVDLDGCCRDGERIEWSAKTSQHVSTPGSGLSKTIPIMCII
jgi:hypothetical protein